MSGVKCKMSGVHNVGFTLIELLIVIGIIIALTAATIPIYGNLQVSAQLNENSAQIIQAIRTAKERSEAWYNNAQHGVYFDINTVGADKYILYQGPAYASRNILYDREAVLGSSLSFSNSSFTVTGNDIDINFSKGMGIPSNIGVLNLLHSVSGSKSISVNSFGTVEEN